MTEEEVERRASALADLIREFDLVEDADSAKSEAYWIVDALHDPAGELGLWRAKDQVKLLDQALSGLGQAEKALESLAPPVKTAISRHTRISRGFLISPSAANALAARGIRLEHLMDISAFPRGAPEDEPAEDVADPAKEITVHVGTLQQSAPALVRELRKALEDNRTAIELAVTRERRTPTGSQNVAEAKMRLDGRRWSAIQSYLRLSEVWSHRHNPPPKFPKDSDPFYQFVERGLEALEIRGIGDHDFASVRSVLEALSELQKNGIILRS